MQKIEALDPITMSTDIIMEKINSLKTLYPEAVREGNIDFDVLRQVLGESVDEREEKYGLNWPGKRRARQAALTPSTGTLRPAAKESVDWENTGNLLIEGDNLEVLKLLQKSYHGQIKMIYIDPPYNTGNDFIYPDDFTESLTTYLKYTGQVDSEGRKFSTNTEASGRFHSKWLCMMYPRLFLARTLLSDDGVMFISIDDMEVGNLRLLANEIFGEENFVANIVWEKKYAKQNDATWFSTSHDHILLYAKNKAMWRPSAIERSEEQLKGYANKDNDSRGLWQSVVYTCNKTKEERPNLYYPITHPRTGEEVWPEVTRVWGYEKAKHKQHEAENRLWWGANLELEKPRLKVFLSEVGKGVVPDTLWLRSFAGDNQEAKRTLLELIPECAFETPKPPSLIKRMLQIACPADGIVLDFFAGSGTTGQAVYEANKEDGGSRTFILVQLPEPTERNDFATITDITKERLRKVAEKQKADGASLLPVDLGFRVFKLDSSNIRAWEADRENLERSLLEAIEHLNSERSEDDILFELLLKLGLHLNVPMESKMIAGKKVHSIGAGVLMVCLSTKIANAEVEDLAQGIVAWHKELKPIGEATCVFRDSAFTDDIGKTNLTAILKQYGLENVGSL